jgi:PEGA domain
MTTTPRPVLAVLLVSALASTSCATMLNGPHQDVLVLSEPSGAAIRLNGRDVGSTPATVRMRRRGPAVLLVDKAGFAPTTIPVTDRSSLALYGNLIFLNPLAAQGMDSASQWATVAAGWFIAAMSLDFWSGGAFARPPVVTVTLPPLPAGPTPRAFVSAPCVPQKSPDCWLPDAPPNHRSRR